MAPKPQQLEAGPLPPSLPELPVPVSEFPQYASQHPDTPVRELLEPYLEYEKVLRRFFAQAPEHEFVRDKTVNLISLFEDENAEYYIRARDLESEPVEEKERYIIPLSSKIRKPSGSPAIVNSLERFRKNFEVFTEHSLRDLDWSNVIVAGSAALTPLLPTPTTNKKALRKHYHDDLAPASDIDLFIHSLSPSAALQKLHTLAESITSNLLPNYTTIRTKNTISIVSAYPNRHIQIVLRLYRSISEILTGFDVDCACVAYDGARVWASPRALKACLTQCNTVDIARRSRSYETRLAKYAKRGFEVYCPFLERSRINPTIFERAFSGTEGLARLLVLEALPTPESRESYASRRRQETGRPSPLPDHRRSRRPRRTNIKDRDAADVAEWDFTDPSGYARFSIPYGPDWNAEKIERMFCRKDVLLNARWNPLNCPPRRTVRLHRHPVFWGEMEEVVKDCCGRCPLPRDEEERAVMEKERETYVQGEVGFVVDDPGRQEIGSFYPLGPEDYVKMAYISANEQLCDAVLKNDVNAISEWCADETRSASEINDRDCCGRTPLHLAVMNATTSLEVVEVLLEHGAKLVARMQDGSTALNLAARAGRADIVTALLRKSEENEFERDERESRKRYVHAPSPVGSQTSDEAVGSEDSYDALSTATASTYAETTTTSGFVKVGESDTVQTSDAEAEDDVLDINHPDWDHGMNPLHHAIVGGHIAVVEALASFGADAMMPIKLRNTHDHSTVPAALMPLNLVLNRLFSPEKQEALATALLKAGASSAQKDLLHKASCLYYAVVANADCVVRKMFELAKPAAKKVLDEVVVTRGDYGNNSGVEAQTALTLSLVHNPQLALFLLAQGAKGFITFDAYARAIPSQTPYHGHESPQRHLENFRTLQQPIEIALHNASLLQQLLQAGADPNTVTRASYLAQNRSRVFSYSTTPLKMQTVLDSVRESAGSCRERLNLRPPVLHKPDPNKKPQLWAEEELEQFPEGSFLRHAASVARNTENANRISRFEFEKYPHHALRIPATPSDLDASRFENERIQAATEELARWDATEKVLLAAGAKTYRELYPEENPAELESHEQQQLTWGWDSAPAVPSQPVQQDSGFRFAVGFGMLYLKPDASRAERKITECLYRKLFEAVWRGAEEDLETVERLARKPGWEDDIETAAKELDEIVEEGSVEIPGLTMAVTDSQGFTALWLAVMRRNFEMAELVMRVVREQFSVEKSATDEEGVFEERYGVDDDASDGGSEGIVVKGRVAKKITIDGALEQEPPPQTTVKCSISPMMYLRTQLPYSHLLSNTGMIFSLSSNCDSLTYAIYENDIPLIKLLLRLADTAEDDGAYHFLDAENELELGADRWNCTKGNQHVLLAIELSNIEVLEVLMETVTFGIAFDELRKDADVEKEEYEGLMVHGKRRGNWAYMRGCAGRNRWADFKKQLVNLSTITAEKGDSELLAWLASERPWECLQAFIASHPSHKRTELLLKQGTNLRPLLREKFEASDASLLFTLINTVPSPLTEPHLSLLRTLLTRSPSIIAETYSFHHFSDRQPPLHLAVSLGKTDLAKELLKPEYNADITARDGNGRNILHCAADSYGGAQELLEGLPLESQEMREAWSQTCYGSLQTPIVLWWERRRPQDYSTTGALGDLEKMKMMLEVSGGRGLEVPDAEGNLLAHLVVKSDSFAFVELVLQYAPQTINRENASGRTPLDLAYTLYLQHVLKVPEIVPMQPRAMIFGGAHVVNSDGGVWWRLREVVGGMGREVASLVLVGRMMERLKRSARDGDGHGRERIRRNVHGTPEMSFWQLPSTGF